MSVNLRRGLFRLWVIISVMFVAGCFFLDWSNIDLSFRRAGKIADFQSRYKNRLMPVNCDQARGKEKEDFVRAEDFCWTEAMHSVTKLYPEYASLDDKTLRQTFLVNAQMSSSWPHPWNDLIEVGVMSLLPPVIVFLLGWSLLWAISGFRLEQTDVAGFKSDGQTTNHDRRQRPAQS